MSKSKPRTPRGCRIFARDEGRRRLRVVESILTAGGPHAWSFANPWPGYGYAVEGLQLSVADARLIIGGLERFVAEAEAGELTEPEARNLDTNDPSRGTRDREMRDG